MIGLPQTGSVPNLFVGETVSDDIRSFFIQIRLREVSAIREWMVCGLLILASMCDLQSHRIDNRIIISGWIFGSIFSYYEYGLTGVGSFAWNALLVFVALFALYCIKCIGPGDAKLLSVIGGLYGYALAGIVILYAFVIVSVAAVIYVLGHYRKFLPLQGRRNRKRYRMHKVPMAVPISMGYFLMLAGASLPV